MMKRSRESSSRKMGMQDGVKNNLLKEVIPRRGDIITLLIRG